MNTKGFSEKINNWWNSFYFHGRPDYILACKMKALKENLKEWSKIEKVNLEPSILALYLFE